MCISCNHQQTLIDIVSVMHLMGCFVSPCRIWPALVLLLFPSTVTAEEPSLLDGWHDVWLFRFLVNMLGYSTIIIPGYLLISYFKRTNYAETGSGFERILLSYL